MKISEMITDKYKLRIPPTVYYDLLADVREVEEEQEPTTKNDLVVDCISRAEAIRVASGYCHPSNVAKELAKLPSVTPQEPRWIPVSERLPKDKETVLVTFKHHISGKTIGLGSVVVLRGKPHWHVREQNLGTYDVIAWMPLPTEPYIEVEE